MTEIIIPKNSYIQPSLFGDSDSFLTSSAMLPHLFKQRLVNKDYWSPSEDQGMMIDLSSPPNMLGFAVLRHDPSERLSAAQMHEKQAYLQLLASKVNDLTVDVFDIIMANWIDSQDSSALYMEDFLKLRGLSKRRDGAYDHDAKEEIRTHLSILNNMWVTVDKVQLFKEVAGTVEKVFDKLHGKLLTISGFQERRKESEEKYQPYSWIIQPGPPMMPFLLDPNKQFAKMTKSVLEFHPIREAVEKRIARHLVWHFRIRQSRGDYLRPFNNGRMLSAAAVKIDARNPARSKDRVERAWDQLGEKNIIRSWQYDGGWDEQIVGQKGWQTKWLKANILFEPSISVEDTYKKITPPPAQYAISSKKVSRQIGSDQTLIQRLDDLRRAQKLSQLVLAEKLDIAPSYLSMLFKGTRTLSREMEKKLISFLDSFLSH